jgi:hypothetical protein
MGLRAVWDAGREAGRNLYRRALEVMPAPLSLAIQFQRTQGRWPNLRRPQSFNEKLQWRKLHDRRPILPVMVDKLAAKALLAERFEAHDWLIPTLWTGPRLSVDILATIPPPYVIKPNHASGRIVINRGEWADLAALAERANAMLDQPHPSFLREWPYDQIRPQLFVEPFIGADRQAPYDYKLYTFRGRVRFIQVDTDREHDHKRALYDPQWRRLPFQYKINQRRLPVARPTQLARMIAFAERIARELDMDFIRADLYEVEGRAWFGELTPFPSSGLARFDPPSADFEIGRFWRLATEPSRQVTPLPSASAARASEREAR